MSVNIYNKSTNSLTKIAGNAISSGEPVSLDNYYTKAETQAAISDTLQQSLLNEEEVKAIFEKNN